ncbi:MAG: hypothetical protein ABL879_13540, partial [Devosia sp.]
AEQLAGGRHVGDFSVFSHGNPVAVGARKGKESMKLTWFGGTTLRIYIGGSIVVVDPDGAPANVRREELLGGADHVVYLTATNRPMVDPDHWRQAVSRPLDAPPPIEIASIGASTLLVSAPGDPPLLVADVAVLPHMGRWVDGAVFVLFGNRGIGLTRDIAVRDLARPALTALAAGEADIDRLFDDLLGRVDDLNAANIAALEPGLALEV